MDSFSTDELFGDFGISSTHQTAKAKHVRFNSDGDDYAAVSAEVDEIVREQQQSSSTTTTSTTNTSDLKLENDGFELDEGEDEEEDDDLEVEEEDEEESDDEDSSSSKEEGEEEASQESSKAESSCSKDVSTKIDAASSESNKSLKRTLSFSEENDSSVQKKSKTVNGIAVEHSKSIDETKLNRVFEKSGYLTCLDLPLALKVDLLVSMYEEILTENRRLKEQVSSASVKNDCSVIDTRAGPIQYAPCSYGLQHGSDTPVGFTASDSPVAKTSSVECYNCGGNHTVNECSEPKNMARIKQKAQQQRQKSNKDKEAKAKRYAMDHKSFTPGVLSEQLMSALGLSPKELPPWIYKMRTLGFPPGHLKEAYYEPSNLKMFGDDGESMKVTTGKDVGTIDESKIYGYPGYNLPVPEGFVDNHAKFNAPPLQADHLKENFLLQWKAHLPKSNEQQEVIEITEKETSEKRSEIETIVIDEKVENSNSDVHVVVDLNSSIDSIETIDKLSSDENDADQQNNKKPCNSPFRKTTKIFDDSQGNKTEGVASVQDEVQSCSSASALILEATPFTPPIQKSHSALSLNVELGTPVAIRNSGASYVDINSSSSSNLDNNNNNNNNAATTSGFTSSAEKSDPDDDLLVGQEPIITDKPALEAFGVGVNKFEYWEETPPLKGVGLKRLKEILSKRD